MVSKFMGTSLPPTGGQLESGSQSGITQGSSYAKRTDDTGFLRSRVDMLSTDMRNLHHRSANTEWQNLTAEYAKNSVANLLSTIADMGFSWNDIAALCKVSVPALRKWRRGGHATGENRRRLASLIALCDIIRNHYMVEEVASWFETPLPGVPVTPLDMYRADRMDLVIEYASSRMEPERALDEFDPGWRERYTTPFEVIRVDDGSRSIQPKE